MTKANDLASLLDANGDVVSSALDNVPASDLVNDTTPQLGGNLDLFGNNITGNGRIDITSSTSPQLKLSYSADTWLKLSQSGGATMLESKSGAGDGEIYLMGGQSGKSRMIVRTDGDVEFFNTDGVTKKMEWNATSNTLDVTGTVTLEDSGGVVTRFSDGTTQFGFVGSGSLITGSDPVDTFMLSSTNGKPLIVRAPPSQTISFDIGSSEVGRWDASGNLLVGKTALGIDTNGFDVRPTGETGISVDDNIVLDLNRTSQYGKIINLRKDDATVGSIGVSSSGDDLYIGNDDVGLRFSNGGNLITPYNVTTQADSNGGFDLGYSLGRFKDLYLSGGVYLGGTGSANLLDSYEEGIISGTLLANSGSFTTATYTGRYRKIGSLVNVAFEATITSIGSGNLGFVIPLPFQADGNYGYSGSGRRMSDAVQFHTVLSSVHYLVARNTCTGGTLNVDGVTYYGSFAYQAL